MFRIFLLLIIGYLIYLIIRFVIGLTQLKQYAENQSMANQKDKKREKDISKEAEIIEEKRLDENDDK